jgi:pantoate--beta-alanine ligase
MEIIRDKDELREQVAEWRRSGDHIAIVPTMGNLHAGHTSLIDIAREHAERVVVTLYVNPTQFGEGEDFAAYPRTMEKDTRRLKKVAADVLFTPADESVYPFGIDNATRVIVPGLTDHLCGSFRPGHFDGVTTVVARLFALVQPDTAVFGQKDYQQQLVIKRMVDDLSLPIEVVMAPTVREDDGLAMSSRNGYLTDEERAIAPKLHEVLEAVAAEVDAGSSSYEELEDSATRQLADSGFDPEYVAVRRAEDLALPDASSRNFVILGAARLGKARLIDNVLVST